MVKEQLFLKTLKFIQDKYKLSFKVHRDNRVKRTGTFHCEQNYWIRYTKKSFISQTYTIYVAYHECGHIFNKLPYKTKKNMIYSEFRAERWALDKMKKDFPYIYKLHCKMGPEEIKIFQKNNYEPYLSAWKMIKEYN
ncbi:MAG: hypothetical protein WC516_09610 [Patescibacteria group bacterium]|jgi:hypothetical protein